MPSSAEPDLSRPTLLPAPSEPEPHPQHHPPGPEPAPAEGLLPLGWTAADAASYARVATATSRPGRVVRVDVGGPEVVTATGRARVRAAAALDPAPAVGDWVAVDPAQDPPAAVAVLPRRSALIRAASNRTSLEQVLAANVDVVVVTEHLDPPAAPGRVERLLLLAWSSGAVPLVVLTKADLAADADVLAAQITGSAPGVDVIVVSAVTGRGLADLRARVGDGRTSVLVGPSGAGKSTLVNALAGTEVMATGPRRADGKGRHTTSHRELVPLPGGGVVLDTPGLRAVGVVADEESLDSAFPEIAELSEQCRFRDCAHRVEPGCAVLAAVDDGALAVRRLESWRKLQREVAWQARRTDARLAAAERARWKQITQSVRRAGSVRP
jgi:ribosome biogenesis GTPase